MIALIFATVQTVLGLPLPDFRVVEPVSFKRLRKSFTEGFLPAFSGKFIYQSLDTIAFKTIQIFNKIRSSSLSTISLVYIKLSSAMVLSLLWKQQQLVPSY